MPEYLDNPAYCFIKSTLSVLPLQRYFKDALNLSEKGELIMTTVLQSGLGAAIGCRYLRQRSQLVFVEHAKGNISLLDSVRPLAAIVSKGTTLLKGTWIFDCETGTQDGNLNGPGDIWWEQIDNIRRQMMPAGGANLVNLGNVNFTSITPAILQAQHYGKTPIPGNDDSSNQLLNGSVFAVRTNTGNLCKIKVLQYGYNLSIQWVTYQLAGAYHVIGAGYATPEDIAVCQDEQTAYVTERTGNLLRIDLSYANRSAAVIIATGLQTPQQIYLDEVHMQAYVVEFSNPGRLLRVDLLTHVQTVLLNGLSNAIGLLISDDLAYAYISEQSGCISRYSLQDGSRLEIACGLINPFFLTWANPAQTSIFVTERAPANRISLVDTIPSGNSVRQVVLNPGAQPSCVALTDSTHLLVCCEHEIDLTDLLAGILPVPGIFKGIGLLPWNLITLEGLADTTSQPAYPYQFTKNSPFGGSLSLQINHSLAWLGNIKYYRILIDGQVRLDTWWDLKLNTLNGRYDIPTQFVPKTIASQPGYYAIHKPNEWFKNSDLAMILDSGTLNNGLRNITIDFNNASGTILASHMQPVLIDNNHCTAAVEMPTVNDVSATTDCGMLNFTELSQHLKIIYVASHPTVDFGTFSWRLCKAGKGPLPGVPECSIDGQASLSPFIFDKDVGSLLGSCPSAAFYAAVYVYAKTINGYSRQSQYDASATVAFALTP